MAQIKDIVSDEPVQMTCRLCKKLFRLDENKAGKCKHSGDWHDTFDKCNAVCAYGLGVANLGKAHWSCCYALKKKSSCPESGRHEPGPAVKDKKLKILEKPA